MLVLVVLEDLVVLKELVLLIGGFFEKGINCFFRIFMAPQALACQVFEVCGSSQEGNNLLGSKLSSFEF